MGGGDRCSFGICDNDRRYPDKLVKRSHVSNLQFHSLPKDPQLSKLWHDKIRQGRQNYLESKSVKSAPIIFRMAREPSVALFQHFF